VLSGNLPRSVGEIEKIMADAAEERKTAGANANSGAPVAPEPAKP
jgi:hypothetical protein